MGGGDVCWNSKKQPTIALLSTEIEYKGVTMTTCEIVWLQKLFSNLEQLVDAHIVNYCDNNSNILTTLSIILGQNPLRCIIILSKTSCTKRI